MPLFSKASESKASEVMQNLKYAHSTVGSSARLTPSISQSLSATRENDHATPATNATSPSNAGALTTCTRSPSPLSSAIVPGDAADARVLLVLAAAACESEG